MWLFLWNVKNKADWFPVSDLRSETIFFVKNLSLKIDSSMARLRYTQPINITVKEVSKLNLKTIDGHPLTRDEFLLYLYDIIKMSSENMDFNYSQFFHDLRDKCEITLEEFTVFIHEISVWNIERKAMKHA